MSIAKKQQSMKNILKLFLLVFTITTVSCKDDKNLNQTSDENTVEIDEANRVEEEQINATNFKTYSGAQLNDWLPNTILEYVKEPTSLEFGSEDLHQIKAYYQYKAGHEKHIELEITNGQTEKDLRIKNSIIQRIEMNFAEDTEDGYTKVHKRNNIEVFEMQGNYNNSSSLEYVFNNQFYVRMDGSNLKAEELWQFAAQLNDKILTNR